MYEILYDTNYYFFESLKVLWWLIMQMFLTRQVFLSARKKSQSLVLLHFAFDANSNYLIASLICLWKVISASVL